MAYNAYKDLPRRAASGKVLCNKAFNIAKNPKHDEFQRLLVLMVYIFLIKSLLLTKEQDLILLQFLMTNN